MLVRCDLLGAGIWSLKDFELSYKKSFHLCDDRLSADLQWPWSRTLTEGSMKCKRKKKCCRLQSSCCYCARRINEKVSNKRPWLSDLFFQFVSPYRL
ncbi:hypothetical protein Fmac_021475 [Flemingia macrophylla]|uniref:Uncharacterized protein n=1 Tax=Flemingia macrophylla TaxID=520843 RepID=A0ABD1LWZ2_9FABA